jgi:hypothetical protein
MTTDGKAYVIRHTNVVHPSDMVGDDLNFDSCFQSLRNVCRLELARESQDLADYQDRLHFCFNAWSDAWGKDVANSVTKLMMVEGVRRGGGHARFFALLVKAGYNPKYQLWATALPEACGFPLLCNIPRLAC